MKIGVFLGNVAPTGGGGYTFQDDIYHALVRLAPESQHTFVVFAHAFDHRDTNLQYVFYSRDGERLPLDERIRYRLGKVYPRLKPIPRYISVPQKAVHELGIEFFWFVSPRFINVDIPYLSIIWDLQHRLQPWFPEVSHGGEWEHREAYLSQMLRRSSAIIAGTDAGKAEIARFYQIPPERIRLLPHPTPDFALTDPEDDGGAILTRHAVPDQYLFYPAQFWSHKNHAGLLYALRYLRDNLDLKAHVVLVGSDAGNKSYLESLVRNLGLSEQVQMLGFVSRSELVTLYRHALALVYPSLFGPENLPPLEAFALGCPVIAARVSGSEEQLGEAALLVDTLDEIAFAQAIKSVYESESLRDTLIERGRQRARQWTGEDFVRGVFDIFDAFAPVRRCWGTTWRA